ncbi:MAG: DUF1207 domain-containing protein [Bacteroidota bacterium]
MKYIIFFFWVIVVQMKGQSADVSTFQLFPDSTFVSAFTADAHAHRTEAENILISKNIRASMGTMIPFLTTELFGTPVQASIGASVHFELHPVGQAQIVTNDYYVDFLTLDIPVQKNIFARWVIGHTSHHFSDNWYERLKLNTSVRYSRDYMKLYAVYERDRNRQWYLGADYAYVFTVGRKISKPWVFQTGGIVPLKEFGSTVLYAAADCKVHHEAGFAATKTAQFGMMLPMQHGRVVRLFLQHRSGLDERGQFFPEHRSFSVFGFSFE